MKYVVALRTSFSITLNAPAANQNPLLAGGSLSVNEILVAIPSNLMVTLPSIAVARPELFVGGKAFLPGSIT